MRRLILQTTAVLLFIATVLLVDAFLAGDISFITALAFTPLCAMSTYYLFAAGLRRPAKARKRRAQRSARPVYTAMQPQLQVVDGQRQGPKGPRAA